MRRCVWFDARATAPYACTWNTLLRALYATTRLINHKLHGVHKYPCSPSSVLPHLTFQKTSPVAPHQHCSQLNTQQRSEPRRVSRASAYWPCVCNPATLKIQSPKTRTRIRIHTDSVHTRLEYSVPVRCVRARNKIINPSRACSELYGNVVHLIDWHATQAQHRHVRAKALQSQHFGCVIFARARILLPPRSGACVDLLEVRQLRSNAEEEKKTKLENFATLGWRCFRQTHVGPDLKTAHIASNIVCTRAYIPVYIKCQVLCLRGLSVFLWLSMPAFARLNSWRFSTDRERLCCAHTWWNVCLKIGVGASVGLRIWRPPNSASVYAHLDAVRTVRKARI